MEDLDLDDGDVEGLDRSIGVVCQVHTRRVSIHMMEFCGQSRVFDDFDHLGAGPTH